MVKPLLLIKCPKCRKPCLIISATKVKRKFEYKRFEAQCDECGIGFRTDIHYGVE